MSSPILRARGVAWAPRDRAVLGPLDLEIAAGESVAIIGPNGAGKTTLLRLLSGVLEPSEGRLSWEDRDYEALGRRGLARRIGYLPQIRPEEIPLTVREMVALARHPHRSPWSLGLGAEDRGAVDRALHRAGISDLVGRPMTELSGGERQMALLATIDAQDPVVWALDEPTGHLDPRHRLDVARRLRERLDEGATLIFVTHELPLAGSLARRVLALSRGKLLADGPTREVLSPDVLGQLFQAPFLVQGDADPPDPRLRY